MAVQIVILFCGSHSMAIMSLQIHIIHWIKLEKSHREMFPQTKCMEEDSTKNHLALAKANRISKYTLFVLFIT